MSQYSKQIDGSFTSAGVAKFLSLPFVPDMIEIWNETQYATTTNHHAISAIGFSESASGTAYATASNATANVGVVLTSGGFTFLSAGTYQYGPALTITGITQASAAVVTTSAAHNLSVGDAVLITGTTGMLQIAGQVYTVQTVGSTTTFTIDVNSSGFAAAATAGTASKLLYADLYVPEGSAITAVSTGTTTTVTTALNHSFVIGQEVYFIVPSAWGMKQLDSTYVVNNTGVVQQAYVTSIPNPNQIVVNVNSTGFTAFAYPTSATAALGLTFPQVIAIGDQNSGGTFVPPLPPQPSSSYLSGTLYPNALTIPGAYLPNTRQGVIVGTGDGTTILHATSDVVRWRASYADALWLNV